jgi:pimeloyl-ACP methyl ester carboxylesterase
MRVPLALALGVLELAAGCAPASRGVTAQVATSPDADLRTEQLALFDPARSRSVPLALYSRGTAGPRPRLKLALLCHGHGGQHTDYSFIARNLVAHGYFVASLQYELPGDPPLATSGNLREARRPNWEQGVQDLLFVRRALARMHPELDVEHLLLVGHSNGGDIAMLFAHEHAARVEKVISLDNRRMPLPRTRSPRVLSIRSSDQVADEGVLPDVAEQHALGMKVIPLSGTRHDDMWDGATEAQKREINGIISAFLED